MRAMRVVLAVLVAALVLPGGAALAAPDPIDTTSALPDIEVKGSIAPTKAQRTSARRLGDVAWNQFGTPSSLVNRDGALGHDRGRQRRRRRARLARAQQGALQAELDREPRAGERLEARRHRRPRRRLRRRRRAARLGRGPRHDRRMKAAGGWRIVSASSTINGDETLAAKPQLKAERAWQKRRQRRPPALARAGPPRRAAKAAAARMEAASRSPASPTSSRPARWRSRPSTTATCRRTSRSCSTRRAASRAPTACSSTPAAARCSRARASSTTRATAAASQTFTFSGALPAMDGGCDTTKGPYTVAADAGVRAIDVFANADSVQNDIVLKLFRGTIAGRRGRHLTRPSGSATRRPAASRPATTSSRCASSRATAPRPSTADLHRQRDPRRQRAARALPRALGPVPGEPAAQRGGLDPWSIPSTDTRQKWCWKASTTAADCDRVIGNLASRAPWDVDGKTGAPDEHTIGNNARTAESLDGRRAARAEPVPPDRARRATTRSRGPTTGQRRLQPRPKHRSSARASTSRRP